MKIGVIKEIKNEEYRVALTPAGTARLVEAGHVVTVQEGAGVGSGFEDKAYRQAGAQMVAVDDAWNSELVVKIKEPLESEYPHLKNQIVFTYFHLAGVSESLTHCLLEKGTTAVAYETVENSAGKLPLLAPMSAVAGNMSPVMGCYYLAKFNHGKGMLLGSLFGSSYGKVVVIGDGVVGRHAAHVAAAMGAQVMIVGRHEDRAQMLHSEIPGLTKYVLSNPENIAAEIQDADLVVGAVLVPGGKAPHVVTEEMVEEMQPASVIVDVSIDQGGCVETARPTSHSEPVFETHEVIHYCVTNMPGAYPRTSTIALTAATLPYVRQLADHGIEALLQDRSFAKGLNTYQGHLTCLPVATALDLTSQFREFADVAG